MTIPDGTWMVAGEDDVTKAMGRPEPQSLRELSPRQSSPPLFRRSVSDERLTITERLAGMLLPLCVTLMALSLLGSAVLLWLATR